MEFMGIRGVVCDVDGVVHSGERPFTEAVVALRAWRQAGIKVLFATNNASRPPQMLAERLVNDGLDVRPEDVLTSAMVGAAKVARALPAGQRVLAIGAESLHQALAEVGRETTDDPTSAGAVLQGYGPQITATDLGRAARAIQAGAVWVATNTDATLPTEWGIAPGNGALVGAVRQAVDIDPIVVGKPEAGFYEFALERLGLAQGEVIAIGDRLETDILGARRAGISSVLVTTGVHTAADAAAAAADQQPEHIVNSLSELHLL